jgi:nitrile hydratase
VAEEELASGIKQHEDARASKALTPDMVGGMLASGPSQKAITGQPRFSPGQQVRTRNMHPTGHTRLPRYARGKVGRIEAVQGAYTFPDDSAHGSTDSVQWLYTVVFAGTELWGEAADKSLLVSIDAWESYLEG